MTKNQETLLKGIALTGGLLAREALNFWLLKKALTSLTGREFGWKDAWAITAVARIIGGALETGRRGEARVYKTIEEFKDEVNAT